MLFDTVYVSSKYVSGFVMVYMKIFLKIASLIKVAYLCYCEKITEREWERKKERKREREGEREREHIKIEFLIACLTENPGIADVYYYLLFNININTMPWFHPIIFYRPKELYLETRSVFISEKRINIFGTFVKLKREAANSVYRFPKMRPKATCNNLNNRRYLSIDYVNFVYTYKRMYTYKLRSKICKLYYFHSRHTRGY